MRFKRCGKFRLAQCFARFEDFSFFFKKILLLTENFWRYFFSSANSCASFALTGQPFSARRIAGAITSA